jgi:hypothetical protein
LFLAPFYQYSCRNAPGAVAAGLLTRLLPELLDSKPVAIQIADNSVDGAVRAMAFLWADAVIGSRSDWATRLVD